MIEKILFHPIEGIMTMNKYKGDPATPVTFGRDSTNTIVANTNPPISRQHGQFRVERDIIFYKDYSRQGTYIVEWNGSTMESFFVHGQERAVKPGSWVCSIYNQSKIKQGMILIPTLT